MAERTPAPRRTCVPWDPMERKLPHETLCALPWARARAPAAPGRPPSALPGLDQPNLEPELIDDALDNEVDELADLLGSLIESRRCRHHDRARFGRQRHVAEMHE